MDGRVLSVLVVEPDTDTADTFSTLLKLSGYRVVTAIDGPTAIVAALESGCRLRRTPLARPGRQLRSESTPPDDQPTGSSNHSDRSARLKRTFGLGRLRSPLSETRRPRGDSQIVRRYCPLQK